MSYEFLAASNQDVRVAPFPVAIDTSHWTIVAWVRNTDTSAGREWFSACETVGSIDNAFRQRIGVPSGGNSNYTARVKATSTEQTATSSWAHAADTWYCMAFIARNTGTQYQYTGEAVYVADRSHTAATTAVTFNAATLPDNYLIIGRGSGAGYNWTGQIADVSVWNKVLSDTELAAFVDTTDGYVGRTAASVAANQGISGNLVCGWSMVSDNTLTYGSGSDLTLTATPTISGTHPNLNTSLGTATARLGMLLGIGQ